ncbi:gastric triacylglycerol lipase-like [Asterias rubens]|uniref:gastric triacylglycerol lipase-like n=1 Tax=Asterias rubens TaxID=7604 RepID=UPI001454F3A6|nr:gastric triacylglycerol lipase-like [Asterias rubens]XP_033644259.1 gastric triacylglycerol lipase-like [Asterias rubens]XP_033644260.1 gastric triacylglycerol lipase-like [Asterias rubens]
MKMLSSKTCIWLFVLCAGLRYAASSSSMEKVINNSHELKDILSLLGRDKGDNPDIKMSNCERAMKFISGLLKRFGSDDIEKKFNEAHLGFDFCKSGLNHDQDVKYNVSGLIASHGYPVEEHEVHTVDGFILTLHRIPHGLKNASKGPKEVVFLQHGLLAAASNWITNKPSQSLGYILADAGFDVWMGNSRGNTYSLKHETLKPDQQKFWEWTWDEMAKYDLPASLNFVLNATGQKQLNYIGHSQGTMIAFAEFSRNQELAKKVKLYFAMGPVATVGYMTSPLFRFLSDDVPDTFFTEVLVDLHLYDFFPSNEFFHFLGQTVCSCSDTVFACEFVLSMFGGYSKEHMNATRLPVYVQNTPAGTSVWNMDHWGQMVESKKCCMYDFGPSGNLQHYNQTTPPEYLIQNMETKVALFYGMRDTLADPTDVKLLIPKLKNLFYNKSIPTYGHMDFIWAVDAYEYVYKDIIGLILNGEGL